MAIVHHAVMQPTKLELLTDWLPSQPWFGETDAAGLERVDAFRIDDPEGEVGVETILVRAESGPVYQVPLTYRGAPLVGAEEFLVGTSEHSVLGTRWIYDGVGDPVYRAVVTATMVTGGTQAEVFYDGAAEANPVGARVVGSGGGGPLESMAEASVQSVDGVTAARSAGLELTILRTPDDDGAAPEGAWTLAGTWADEDQPTLLAYLVDAR